MPPTDMQYKDALRKDKFVNDLVIEALEKGDIEKALEYVKKIMTVSSEHSKSKFNL